MFFFFFLSEFTSPSQTVNIKGTPPLPASLVNYSDENETLQTLRVLYQNEMRRNRQMALSRELHSQIHKALEEVSQMNGDDKKVAAKMSIYAKVFAEITGLTTESREPNELNVRIINDIRSQLPFTVKQLESEKHQVIWQSLVELWKSKLSHR
jgi:hypothetical protein